MSATSSKPAGLWARLTGSFDNMPGGMSARKLSAFVGVVAASLIITHRYTNSDNLVTVLTIWLTFSLLCLGIVTAEQVIRFREGKKDEEAPK